MIDFRLAEETVTRLLQLPSPFEQDDWWTDNVAYLEGCQFDQNDVAGLLSVLEAWAIDSAETDAAFFDDDEGAAVITAWRLIGKLKAVDSLPAMLRCLDAAAGDDDDDESESWETTDLPYAFVLLGPGVADDLMAFAGHASHSCGARMAVLESIRMLGTQYPSVAGHLSQFIVKALENAAENPRLVNSELMATAMDWKLVESAEAIERAFSLNRIDCGYAGDWNEVRQELGVQGLGLEMPEKPYNSLDDFRRNVGSGCFSTEMLFEEGEFDEDAVDAYLEEACRAFAASSEGRKILGEEGHAFNVRAFLEFAANYCGVTVDTMTIADAEEVLLELFPRKVSMEAEHCDEVIAEVAAFWQFVDRVHDLEHAAEMATTVAGLSDPFREVMSDPSNFGIAKSIIMMGNQAGFDMTSQEDLSEFMGIYNASLVTHPPEHSVTPPMSADQKRLDRKNRKKLLAGKTQSKKKR